MRKSDDPVQDTRLEVLRALQLDCDRTNTELAQVLNVNTSTVTRARQQLEQSGAIKGYKAILDPDRSGFTTLGFLEASVTRRNPKARVRLIEALISDPNVQEVYDIQGPYNLLIKVRFRSNEELQSFASRIVDGDLEVRACKVVVAMKVWKEEADLPV